MITLKLSFPSKKLSPNARGHWRPIHKARQALKMEAYIEGHNAKLKKIGKAPTSMHYIFHPPGNYGYDKDGLLGRMKYAQDGIAKALGVDDYHFPLPTMDLLEADKPLGHVLVQLEFEE